MQMRLAVERRTRQWRWSKTLRRAVRQRSNMIDIVACVAPLRAAPPAELRPISIIVGAGGTIMTCHIGMVEGWSSAARLRSCALVPPHSGQMAKSIAVNEQSPEPVR